MIDVHSPTWAAVKAHAEKEIAAAQAELEAHGLKPRRTEYLRGRISTLRDLLAIVQAKPEIEAGTGNYS